MKDSANSVENYCLNCFRRSSGGPELFLTDCTVDSSTWQRWRREVLLVQRMGVADPAPVLEPLLSRRRGSLPVEMLAATQSGLFRFLLYLMF